MSSVFEVERDDRSCVVRSRTAVRFEACGDALELRAALRSGLEGLRYGPREGLSCVLYGALPARADVENLLLYNIDSSGGRSAGAAQISFEQVPSRGDWPYTYAYRVSPPTTGFAHYAEHRVIARVGPAVVADGSSDRLLDRVWLAVNAQDAVRALAEPRGPLALRLRVALPRRPNRGIAGMIKGIFDGVVAALAVDAGSSTESITRLAARHGFSFDEIAGFLRAGPAPLGATRLLDARGATSVHWRPPDDQLVAGALALVERPAARLTLEGELIEVSIRS